MSEKPTTTRARNRLNRSAPGMMRLEQRLMFDGAAADAVLELAAPPVIDAVHAPLEVITPPAVDQQSTRSENLFELRPGTTGHAELIGAATRTVQDRLSRWFSRDDYLSQAAIPFSAEAGSAEWSDNAKALQDEVLGGGYTLRLEIRSSAELEGALGAYSASGTGGRPTVYLNAEWLTVASEQALEAVLLEEVGHDIDQRLNGGADSTGDEGHAFAALLLHGDANLQSVGQSDGKTIQLDGQNVVIEEAAPYNIAQVTFIPMPEAQLNAALTAIYSTNANSNIETIISITSTSNNTQLVYDHWEDGYEADLRNPLQASTQIWGDGDLTNGVAPGTSNDLLNASQTVLLRNTVAIGSPNTIDYDGRDKIGSSKAIAVTRAGWNQGVTTIVAGAVNLLDVGNAGKNYVLPVGQNVNGGAAASKTTLFEYTSIHLMAFENGTTINIDRDGNGVADQTLTLNQGEAAMVDTGLNAGTRVTSDKGIGLYMIAGDQGASENRWFGITPLEQWSTSYYAPVATVDALNAPAHVFIHNPNATAITVFYDTKSSTGNQVVVNAKSTNAIQVPVSAVHFYTTNGAKFYAVGTIDSGNVGTSSTSHDWSYSLVPESYLTDKFVVAWGPGSSNTPPSGAPLNGSPIWVTSAANTWLYVDSATVQVKRSDEAILTGEVVDANTTRYAVTTLESYRISDTSDKDQTGLVVYTLDGTLITAAWGEDPSVAAQTAPYLDMGTTVLPYPDYVFRKVSTEASPVTFGNGTSDGDTLVELNEQIEYSITIANRAVIDLFNVNIKDALTPSDSASYVAGSANLTVLDSDGNVLLYNADLDGAVNSFPLAGAGYTLADSDPNAPGVQGLQRGHQIVVKYRVQVRSDINQSMADDNYVISNTATLAGSPPVGDPIDPKSTTRETKVSAIDARPQSVVESASLTGRTFTISNLVGLTKITVGTADVTLAQLTASGTTPIAVTTAEGLLTIGGYNATTGVVTYAYDPAGLSKNHSAGAITDNVALSATYGNGAVVVTTLAISVTDTSPTANADTKRIIENATSVSDNVISGATAADVILADAASVSGVVSGNVAGPVTGNVGSSVAGAYGSINLGSNGAYTYVLDNANAAVQNLNDGESITDVFTYTLTDADGSRSTTRLSIGIDGVSDTPPSFSVDDVTVNEAAGALTFTITKAAGTSPLSSSLNYATANGTALAGTDYTAASGTLNFLVGETSKTVTIAITNDNIFELSEAFSLNLTVGSNATITDGTGVGTIKDDGTGAGGANDDRPSFSVNDVTVNEAAGTLTFSVTKAGLTNLASSVDFATANGTALAGADYTAASGTLSFLAGETTKTVSIAINDDSVFELSEAFNLNLTNASNAVIGDGTGVGTIRDDGTGAGGTNDDRPSFSVNDVTVNEAAGTLSFTVTKTGLTDLTSTVTFATADGTATAGADYTASSGTLSLLAGETTKTVSIAINDDNVFELSEAFNLNLSNATNALISGANGIGTIRDDGTGVGGTNDDRPSFSVNDVTVNEAAGTLSFTVTKAGATALTSTVDFATVNGTATSGTDYTAASGTLSFLSGETTKTVSIAINDDNVFELSEAFSLNLSNASNAVIGDGTGVGAIRDDGTGAGGTNDDRPSFSVNDVTVNEAAGTLSFTVTKAGLTNLASTVDFATANGTALAGSDYTAAAGTLSFLAGETTKTVSIAINDDNVFELSEAFSLNLSNASNAVIGDGTGVGAIRDDGTGVGGTNDDRPSFSVNDVTVNEAAGTLSFTVTKAGLTNLASTVDFATANGTALAGSDYTAATGTLSFLAGETSKTVSIAITNDNVFELSEAFSLNLSNASNAVIGDGTGVGTIRDDGTGAGGTNDDRPSFTVNDVTVNEAAGTLSFTVTKAGLTNLTSTVDFATANGTATSGTDYTAASGTLSFLSGETTKTVSIAITNDNVFELSEAFSLNLSNASNAVIGDGTGVGTIRDDGTGAGGTNDDRPSFSVNDVTVNEAAGTLSFTVTKTGLTDLTSTVDFATANGTATAGADYTAASGTLSFLAGETSKTVNIAINDDTIFELTEAFNLNLTNAGNAVSDDGTGIGTIKDDGTGAGGTNDDRTNFVVNDVVVNEAAGTLTFTVTKAGTTTLTSTVDFATANGTALAGADYTAASGTLSFLAGETSKTVSIAITNDNVFEFSEGFSLNLSNASNAIIGDATGLGTIMDDGTGAGGTNDDRPSFSVDDVTVNEAAGTLSFTVTRSGLTNLTSTVDFATVNGTATSGTDYTAASGTLSFLSGETTKTVSIAITNDNVFELSEAFSLKLANAANAVTGDGVGIGTIKDDGTGAGGTNDDRPSFSVNDVTVNEAAGTLTFTVTKTGLTDLVSTVDFATANGTALAGADYTAASGTLSFLAGETTKTVSIAINDDNVFELSEAFSLNLSNASNAVIGDGTGVGAIRDDGTGAGGTNDDRPSFSVNDVTVNEAAGTLSFTVTKAGLTNLASTVDFATANGTALAGSDYTAATGTLSFLAGETSKTVSIAITNDNVFELSEAFSLSLANAANAVIGDGTGVGTIRDDGTGAGGTNDDRPNFTVNHVTVNEAAGTLSFTVTKAGLTNLTSTVDFATANGTALAGSDYTAASGTLSFLAGETVKTVSIAINDDNVFELSEAFSLNLSNASNALIADASGVGTIRDDGTGAGGSNDDRPSFSVNDVTVNEAAGTLSFTVTKTGSTTLTSTVDFATANGTATSGTDYTAASGTLSFLTGETTKTLSIAITNDNAFELSEAFSLNLSNAANAVIGDGTGLGTITDDGTGPGGTNDDRPSFSVNNVTVNEAAGTLSFTVTKAGLTNLTSTVDFATVNGTATSGTDYTASSGMLSFLAGETSKTITISITNDNVFELSEAFSLNLSKAANAVIGDGVGIGTIKDDGTGAGGTNDDRPSFTVNDVTVNEAAGTLTFTVTKTGLTDLVSTVDFATANGTATSGADYTAASGTLSFQAGETSKTVGIAINDDTLFELSEAFNLNLSNASNALVSDATGVGTIKDDGTGAGGTNDDRPNFSVNDVTVNEAAGTLSFTVTKTGSTGLASTVDYATADGAAIAGLDYTATSGTLNFLAGETSKTVNVAITNDNVFELSEAFFLNLTNASNVVIADAQGIGTITDDGTGPGGVNDDRPVFSINDVAVNEAAGTLTFTVTKTGLTDLASTVDFATADGTALAGADYTASSGTLSFLAGETSKTVSIAITNDNVFELSEAFSLNLTNAGNAVIGDGIGIGAITDDGTGAGGTNDDRPSFSVNDVTVNEAAGTLSFTVTKSGATTLGSTVDFSTADGTATVGSDYTATSGTLSFLAGETSKTVSIAITNDNVFELSEAFSFDLSNASDAVIGDGLGIGTIMDDGTGPGGSDDDRPSFSVNDVTINEAAGTLSFTVTKSGATALTSTVDFTTADGTATAGADYTATDGTLSFLTGETSKTVSVAITNDDFFELSEAFSLNLSNASSAVIADGLGVGTIKDDGTGPGGTDDDRPSFSVNDVTVNEAAGTLTFMVTKSGATTLASTVDFATANGAATGTDYIATSGTLSFLAGETSKTVSVAITNDNLFERSEAFSLNLSNAGNAVIADGLGIGTIKDDGTGPGGLDDDRPSFSVNDVTVNEAAGTLIFTVTKTGATELASTVDFATAEGTALAGADYTATSGTLSFLAGETSKTVSVAITDDKLFELSEAFSLNLSNASNAVGADGLAVGTVRDDGTGSGGSDDDRPSFSVDDVTVNEAAGSLTFTVTRVGATTLASTVDFATANGTAAAGADYTAISGTLSFLAGETSKTVSVAITNDDVFELSEAFNLNLSNGSNAVIADDLGAGTIKDDGTGPGGTDDDRPSFSVNDVTVNEAAGTLSFTVAKTGATALASTVDFATADGTAVAGADYTATGGTLSFLAGESSKTVTVAITNDNVFELSEAFNLNLSNASNATIADGTGGGVINDDGTGPGGTDDDRPSFSVNDVTVNEAAGTLTFTVTKAGATALSSRVDFATANGTSTAGADYTAASGTLSFLAGETSKTVSVAITNDNAFELSEAFSLNLSTASNAVIADGLGVGTIKDDGTGPGGTDDDRPSFSVNDATVNEAAGTLTFTVTKTGATALASTINVATVDGTAVAGADYTAASGTLSFLTGETSKTVTVSVTNDTVFELSEALSLNLSNASNAVLADGTGIGTIKDDGTGPGGTDDDRPSFSVADVEVNEAAGTLTFTVTKAGATALASSVNFATADGTATAGADYTANNGTLNFLAGETSKTVSIVITNDNLFELSEAFALDLSNAGNAVIGDGTASATIKDDGTGPGGTDDDRPSFSIDDVTVNEAAGTLTFTVTKTGATALNSTVDYTTRDGTALATADYEAARGTLSFLAGESSRTVTVRITNDNFFELSEAFSLDLSNAGQAHIGVRMGLAIIKDDGTGPGGLDDDRVPPVVQAPPAPVEPAPPRQPVTEPLGRIETLSEFPILAADLVLPDLRHDLTLERDIPDQPLPANGAQMSFTIPTDTFVHSDTTAQVSLAASMIDGTALPSWLKFDPATGSFSGTPPRGLQGELQVKVLARDDIGRQAETIVRIASELPVPRAAEAVNNAMETRLVTASPSSPAADGATQVPTSPAADQRSSDVRPSPATITTLSGFQVLVDKGARSASDHELRLNQSIPDQVFPRGLLLVRYQVPVDAFIHTDSAARVVLSAAMIDGSELPQWLQFKAEKGEFKGMPPLGFKGDLLIKVIARDGAGRQAETIVRISIGETADKVVVGGKPALTTQMRPFGVAGWKAERDRLVAHAHEATVKARTAKAA